MAEENQRFPHNEQLVFRIGINLGDVVIEGDDIHGDGVNVAARLEALSAPGGICVSGGVYDQVRDRLDLTFTDMGEQTVKNIDRPVRVWRWQVVSGSAAPKGGATPRSEKPSIAVLPFNNMSGDSEQEYFADGMVEEIITGLACIRWLTVIGRNSTFAYKGKSPDLRTVGQELSVRYVLEGSVRRAGDRVRITAQLIEAETGGHLWADRFDGTLADVFDLQDQITADVVAVIEPSVRKAEMERAKRKRPDDLDAYDFYLRALAQMYDVTPDARTAALALVDQALAANPGYAEAHGVAAWCYFARSLWEDGLPQSYRDNAVHHAQAVQRSQCEDASTLAHAAIAIAVGTRDYAAAIEMINRAIAINPSSVHAHGHGAVINLWAGNYETAIDLAERSLRLSPLDPLSVMPLGAMAGARHMIGDDEEAITIARRAVQIYPTHTPSHLITIASLMRLGRIHEVKVAIGNLKQVHPEIRLGERESFLGKAFTDLLLKADQLA
jgi:adenylate cyclase